MSKKAIVEDEEILFEYEGVWIWLGFISFVVELEHSTTN